MSVKCRCDSKPCSKAEVMCGDQCHMRKEGGDSKKDKTTEELMNVILANEGDYVFILSLSGKIVQENSSKAELGKAYLMLSSKVHPDKNSGSSSSNKAFQAVSESFERLANPEKFEEDDDDGKPAKRRQKTERFSRGNSGPARGRGHRFNMQNGGGPLREPRGGGAGYHQGQRHMGATSPRGGQPGGGERRQQQSGPNNVKSPPKIPPFKIATMGNKGKEKYMATVTVEGQQFKTYPQTYNTQAEAEEALSAIIVKKLGIRGSDGDGASVQETTQDMTVLADRVVTLIGDRQNGVWSTQIEKQYQDMFGEKLPSLWFQEVEAINRIRVDCPIPGRYIVFPVLQSVSSSGSATWQRIVDDH